MKAFINLEVGLTRGAVPDPSRVPPKLKERIAEKNQRIAELEAELLRSGAGDPEDFISPDRLVWMFCVSRSGSTWLARMLEDLSGYAVWHEPGVGQLFGGFYYQQKAGRGGKHYILGGRENTWLVPLRTFILQAASYKFPEVVREGYLAAKEPSSAIGAPLVMKALPESRMIFLVRDPRDVAASSLDAHREGSWFYEQRKRKGKLKEQDGPLEDERLDAQVRMNAGKYLAQMERGREAYESHEGPKVLIKYEDLRADTLKEMERIHAELGIPVDREELARVVAKHSWENIPKEQKGEGKFYRKGSPGGWREDLTPGQVEIVESVTGPLIERYYPG